MKIIKTFLLVLPVILLGSITTFAQKPKTASAMAAYGMSPAYGKHKSKKKHKHQQPKTYQTRELRINKEKRSSTRKRGNWAS